MLKILAVLEILDKVCFELCDVNEVIDQLYTQIFPKLNLAAFKKPNDVSSAAAASSNSADKSESDGNCENTSSFLDEGDLDAGDEMKRPLSDRDIIYLLCDWATTTRRSGLHRIFYAVFLIKKRQIDLITQVLEANKQIRQVTLEFLQNITYISFA